MSSLMNQKVVRLCKLSIAELADEPLLLFGVPGPLWKVVVVGGPNEADQWWRGDGEHFEEVLVIVQHKAHDGQVGDGKGKISK